MTHLEFWIPTLGSQSLSSNGGKKSRHPLAVAAAKDALGEAAYFACLNAHGPAVPALMAPVDVYLDFHICHRRRPGDGLYRFTDPSNGGGNVAKPIVDYGIVKPGIIPDDTYAFIRFFTTHITSVPELADEGIAVRVTEVRTEDDAGLSVGLAP